VVKDAKVKFLSSISMILFMVFLIVSPSKADVRALEVRGYVPDCNACIEKPMGSPNDPHRISQQ
jgi:hypothetical protein